MFLSWGSRDGQSSTPPDLCVLGRRCWLLHLMNEFPTSYTCRPHTASASQTFLGKKRLLCPEDTRVEESGVSRRSAGPGRGCAAHVFAWGTVRSVVSSRIGSTWPRLLPQAPGHKNSSEGGGVRRNASGRLRSRESLKAARDVARQAHVTPCVFPSDRGLETATETFALCGSPDFKSSVPAGGAVTR